MIVNDIDLDGIREAGASGATGSIGEFLVDRHIDVRVSVLPPLRRSSYRELRSSPKSEHESVERFLVESVHTEAFPAEAGVRIAWERVGAKTLGESEVEGMYARLRRETPALPAMSEVESLALLDTGCDLDWLFAEGGGNYHSLFWRDTEKRLLKRRA